MGGMPPSVGRIVHFWNNPHKAGDPSAAIITAVVPGAEGNAADLEVFGCAPDDPDRFPPLVRQYGKEDVTRNNPCWDWPQVIPSGKAGA